MILITLAMVSRDKRPQITYGNRYQGEKDEQIWRVMPHAPNQKEEEKKERKKKYINPDDGATNRGGWINKNCGK